MSTVFTVYLQLSRWFERRHARERPVHGKPALPCLQHGSLVDRLGSCRGGKHHHLQEQFQTHAHAQSSEGEGARRERECQWDEMRVWRNVGRERQAKMED